VATSQPANVLAKAALGCFIGKFSRASSSAAGSKTIQRCTFDNCADQSLASSGSCKMASRRIWRISTRNHPNAAKLLPWRNRIPRRCLGIGQPTPVFGVSFCNEGTRRGSLPRIQRPANAPSKRCRTFRASGFEVLNTSTCVKRAVLSTPITRCPPCIFAMADVA